MSEICSITFSHDYWSGVAASFLSVDVDMPTESMLAQSGIMRRRVNNGIVLIATDDTGLNRPLDLILTLSLKDHQFLIYTAHDWQPSGRPLDLVSADQPAQTLRLTFSGLPPAALETRLSIDLATVQKSLAFTFPARQVRRSWLITSMDGVDLSAGWLAGPDSLTPLSTEPPVRDSTHAEFLCFLEPGSLAVRHPADPTRAMRFVFPDGAGGHRIFSLPQPTLNTLDTGQTPPTTVAFVHL